MSLTAIKIIMCKKAVDDYGHALELIPDCYKTQQFCEKSASKDRFMLKYYHDTYKNHEMWHKNGDAFIPILKFVLMVYGSMQKAWTMYKI